MTTHVNIITLASNYSDSELFAVWTRPCILLNM